MKLKSLFYFPLAMMMIIPIIRKAGTSSSLSPVHSEDISGGTVVYDFSDETELNDFDTYSELSNQKPHILKDSLYNWVMCEQKTVLKDYTFSDVVLETTIGTINPSGKFDCGLFFGGTSFGDKMDQAYAWNINVEHGVNSSKFSLKLHQFTNRYADAKVQVSDLAYPKDNRIKLVAAIKNGVLSAYVNDIAHPVFTTDIASGSSVGKVGFRCYYSPNYFEYLKITSPTFHLDTTGLTSLYQKAKALSPDDYSPKSYSKLKTLLDELDTLTFTSLNQIAVDKYITKLEKLIDQLIARKTYSDLQSLIDEVKNIRNDDGKYTTNSYNSFAFCLTQAQALTESSSTEDISYWFDMLTKRKNALIIRNGGVR